MRFTTGTSAPAIALYRVFLLESGLQVDIAFTLESDFGARSPSFQTIFGEPVDVPPPELPAFADVAGLGWLGLLHASKAIERGRPWEATYWIGSVRDQTLTAACPPRREPALPRGADGLPTGITAPLEETLVSAPRAGELGEPSVRPVPARRDRPTDAPLALPSGAALAGG